MSLVLPGMDKQPRAVRLTLWLREHGYSLAWIARRWNVQKSYPGKCLMAETEPLPEYRHKDLINLGVPPKLLPVPRTRPRKPRAEQGQGLRAGPCKPRSPGP